MPDDDVFIAEDCGDPTEADSIADQYRLIIRKMKSQLEAQKEIPDYAMSRIQQFLDGERDV